MQIIKDISDSYIFFSSQYEILFMYFQFSQIDAHNLEVHTWKETWA